MANEEVVTTNPDDSRFDVPLYTVAEAASFLGVPPTSFRNWARGYCATFRTRPPVVGRPIVTSFKADRLHPSIPFIGLAEAFVVAALRCAGVSLQHIRKAVAVLERDIGLDHALASQRLFTDGASLLYDYASVEGDEELLTHVVTQQRVLADVVREYLSLVTYGTDGWPLRLVSPVTAHPVVAADPTRGFGQPIFIRGGVKVENVLERIRGGDQPRDVAADMGVPMEDIEAVLGVEAGRAA